MTFFSLAALAMFGTACERHSASELSEHGVGLQAPPEVPQNPAGAGPASVEDKKGAPSGEKNSDVKEANATPAPKGSSFFPSNK